MTKLDPSGSRLLYSTYVGGSGSDAGKGIVIDRNNQVYITGTTASPDFPTTPGAIQGNLTGKKNAFVAGLDSSGSHLTWSTYLGGSGDDENNALGIDPQGDLYLTGTTTSADFPGHEWFVPADLC